MNDTKPWWNRERLLLLAALVGWAGFVGTGLGVLSVRDRIRDAEHHVARSQAQLDALRGQLQTTQRLNDEMFETSRKLNHEQEQIIRSLREKIRDLEARLSKYEPIPPTGSSSP
ncbi:MAG: hypothetical protein NZM31_08090 [Gemmatales bacterium]|nr:hypothetical protein [Gemmatales bacterium]MDW8386952.1 hypothetical protein [Gemmatales bacterium]